MTADQIFLSGPPRVMAEIPRRDSAIGEGLRATFQIDEVLPCDIARLLERLRALS